MAHNYFISYDLIAPGQHYDRVITAIHSCGAWAKVELSFYYVNSDLDIDTVMARVWNSMTPNDKLIIIDATTNSFRAQNLAPEVAKQMQDCWNR